MFVESIFIIISCEKTGEVASSGFRSLFAVLTALLRMNRLFNNLFKIKIRKKA